MIGWMLFALMAHAQAPQDFDPFPAAIELDGETYQGILVDEELFAEIGALRTEKKALEADVQSFREWKADRDEIWRTTLAAVKEEHEEGQAALVEHYETQLRKDKRKDAFQRHAYPIGVASGVVVATAIFALSLRFYGDVLTDEVQSL